MRWWLLALGFAAMSCQREVRVVDLDSASDALVFLVHLDGADQPQSVDGPFIVGPDGRLNEGPQTMLPASADTTEGLVVSLEALEDYTAGIDRSSRKRLRFRRDARCWRQGSCTPTLEASEPPAELKTELEVGASVGSLVLAPPAGLVGREDSPPAWLGQLSLRIPFDLESVEEEQLEPFGQVEDWLLTVGGPVGLADFLPLTSDRVLLLQGTRACIVDDDTAIEDICAPGPRRFVTDGLLPEPASFWRIVARPGPNPSEVFITARSAGNGHVVSVQLSEAGFGAAEVLTSTDTAFSELGLGPDGRLLVAVEHNSEEIGGTLSAIEIAPGQPEVTRLIRSNLSPAYPAEVSRSQLTTSEDPAIPFVAATQHSIHRFEASAQEWVTFEFGRDPRQTLTTRDVVARRGEDGRFRIYSSHTKGRLFRFREQDGFEERRVSIRFPEEYASACDPNAHRVESETVQDFRALFVRGLHDAFVVVEPCQVLLWFDPEPETAIDERVSLIRSGELGTQWPSSTEQRPQHQIRLFDDHVWVGGGPSLLRVRRPVP